MIITIVLLLSIKSLFAIPCSLSRLGLAPAFTACLKTISKDTDELENFIGTVIEYVKNSPYPHLFMGGPNGWPPFDVLGELTSLKTQATGWPKTVLDFYEQIRNIIGKLKDPHSSITFPFLGSFAYLLPYGFAPVAENETSFKLTANVLTADSLPVAGGTDYTGYIIDEMDLKNEGYKPAAVALSELALDVGNAGHDPHALFNSVVKSGNIFMAGELFRPDERYNPVVKLKGKDKNGSPVEDITIPWLGYYIGAEETSTLDELNPLVEDGLTHRRSRNGKKHINKDSIKHFLPHMMMYNQIPPIFLERERMMKEIKRQVGVDSKFSANSAKHESRLITSMYEKKLATHRPQPSPSPSLSRSLSSVDASMLPAIDLDAVTLEKLYEFVDAASSESTCTIYADAANKLGYIRYKSFSQGLNDKAVMATFFSEFGNGYKSMVDKGVTDVIFDVRGNPGGALLIVEEFTDFFFHNSISPADLDTDVLLGDLTGGHPSAGGNYIDLMVQKFSGTPTFYKLVGGEPAPIDILSSFVEKTHVDKLASTAFKANYTQRAFFTQRLATSIRNAYGGYSPFDPEHFYIVTDGVCASCCGIFTKLAVESKAAHVLGYGVNPTKKDDISTYVPGNCAGSLLGTRQVENFRQGLEILTAEEIAGVGLTQADIDQYLTFLPPQFERTGVSFGVTDYEFFSRNPAHADQTLYMVPALVEDVLPLQVSSDPDTDAVLKEIVAVTKNLYIDKDDSDSAAVASVPALLLALFLAMLVFW